MVTRLWRAFDKTVSRKPLAFAVDAVYGNSIDSGLEVLQRRDLDESFLNVLLPAFTAEWYAAAVFLSSAETLARIENMRKRLPRKRLRADGLTGNNPL